MRTEFANICKDLIKDEKTVLLLGDISHFLLRESESIAPDRFFNIGICEQSIIGIAAGLAMEGYKPIVHTIAPFMVERAYEQIKIDLGYQRTNVTLVSVGASFDYSDLGCTHHCYGDIAALRLIPNLEIYVPGTGKELRSLLLETWNNNNPKYFRLSSKTHNCNLDVKSGEINLVRTSKNNKYVFVTGHLLDDVLENEEIGVLYVSTLSHINQNSIKFIKELIKHNDGIYTVENHFKSGGLGDLISETFNVSIKRIAINKFITSYGSYDDLREECGLSKQEILKKIL
jgi:transketolase